VTAPRRSSRPVRATATSPAEPGNRRQVLLVVLGDRAELGTWQRYIDLLGDVLGLPGVSAVVPQGSQRLAAVLNRAAGARGPVLIVPGPPASHRHPATELQRVLAPFDTSDEVTASLRPVLLRLQSAGVRVVQLHVLTNATMPVMWEGSGHHAAAWRAELRHRHQVGVAEVEVVVGLTPAEAVIARSADADLVLLCWNRSSDDGRAETVRRVLAATDVPVLLLPLP
jgi:hypothetical protein